MHVIAHTLFFFFFCRLSVVVVRCCWRVSFFSNDRDGRARQSTALCSAELALRCRALLSWAAGHRRVLHGASLLWAIALRWGAGRCGAHEPSPDLSWWNFVKYKTNGGNQRKAKAGPFRNKCTGGKLAANGRKVELTRHKERKHREKVQNRVGRKTKFAGSSWKVKKQLAKRAETKTIKCRARNQTN